MKAIVTLQDHIVGPWIAERTGGGWQPGRGSTIGLLDLHKRQFVAGTIYCDCNGASVTQHIAAEGKSWLNREYLWFCFYYPFEQLRVNKLICPVESDNDTCIRFIKHLGYTCEATLRNASPKGDLLLYTMEKENCKWLALGGQYRGQLQGKTLEL